MNNYLLFIGSNVEQIRKILNLTQEDLANKLGISRPTIVKLEQDPSRITKTLALALFMVVSYEISTRLKNLTNIDPSDYKKPEDLPKFITAMSGSTALATGAIATAALSSIGKVIPGVGALVAGIATYNVLKNKKGKPKDSVEITNKENWNEKQGQKFIDELKNVLMNEQKKLLDCFNLQSFSIEEFMNSLESNED